MQDGYALLEVQGAGEGVRAQPSHLHLAECRADGASCGYILAMDRISEPTRLFGDPHRAGVLVAVAPGPIHLRAISRAVSLGYRGTWNIVADLISEGVLEESIRSSKFATRFIRLSPAFSAYVPLLGVLRILMPMVRVDSTQSNLKLPRRWRQCAATAKVRALFGTPERTQALIYVAIAGKTDSPEMQHALRQSQQGLTKSIRFFERMGLLRRCRSGKRTVIEFDRGCELAMHVESICTSIAIDFPRLAARAKALSAAGLTQIKNTPYYQIARRLPFMRASHVRIIVALLGGPKRTTEIASLVGVGALSARQSLKYLSSTGIVVLTTNSNKLIASLSCRSEIDRALLKLIAKLTDSKAALPDREQLAKSLGNADPVGLFHNRYLSMLIDAFQERETTGLQVSVAVSIARRLQWAGLVELGTDRLPICLAKNFVAHSEVRAFCRAVVQATEAGS